VVLQLFFQLAFRLLMTNERSNSLNPGHSFISVGSFVPKALECGRASYRLSLQKLTSNIGNPTRGHHRLITNHWSLTTDN
jgi:hypothetical protein